MISLKSSFCTSSMHSNVPCERRDSECVDFFRSHRMQCIRRGLCYW